MSRDTTTASTPPVAETLFSGSRGRASAACPPPSACWRPPAGIGRRGGQLGRPDRHARDSMIAASMRSPIPVATRNPARICGSVPPASVDRVMAETRRPATRNTFPSARFVDARLEAGFTPRTVPKIRCRRCRDLYLIGAVGRSRGRSVGVEVRAIGCHAASRLATGYGGQGRGMPGVTRSRPGPTGQGGKPYDAGQPRRGRCRKLGDVEEPEAVVLGEVGVVLAVEGRQR